MARPTEAGDILAAALLEDATAHESGAYDRIAARYDEVYGQLLPIQDLHERRFAIAFYFWDGWCDARNHDWLYYPGIDRSDWPRLARHIAAGLQRGLAATEPLVIERFAPESMRPMRKRLWDWMRIFWRRSA